MPDWKMDAPVMFGAFHITASLAAAALAAAAARFVAGRIRAEIAGSSRSGEEALIRALFRAGILLFVLEAFKQIYIYTNITLAINDGRYDWWYFPFQLCSMPMYLCLLLPLTGRITHLRQGAVTFMSSYTLVSAAAALIWPEDYLRSSVLLTLHGFIWHGILLFISLLIIRAGALIGIYRADGGAIRSETLGTEAAAFGGAAVLFAVLACIAVIINIAVEPQMAEGCMSHAYAAMFYLNPLHLSPQPLVSDVQRIIGIPAGLVLYALTVTAASGLVHMVISWGRRCLVKPRSQ